MNVLNKLVIKSLKLNKKRTIGTIIGIVLSVALICAVSSMVSSFRQTLVENAINESGYYHIELLNINDNDINKLKLNKDIKDINLVYKLGYSSIEIDSTFPYIEIASMDKDTLSNLSYELIEGRYPENDNEIVIDKMVYDKTKGLEMIGYYEVERMVNSRVFTNKEYTIVGIVDMGSPSIYASRNELYNIIINGKVSNNYEFDNISNEELDNSSIYSYDSYRDKIAITKGREPSNDYEVIINESYQEEYKLNKEIDKKVNGKKLVVVGYYKSEDDINSYFVSSNTKKYDLIENSKGIIIYTKDKDKVINNFKDIGVKVIDVYQSDRNSYIDSMKDSVNASLIVAGIMLGISLIEIILMTRSSFLSRIKEVGIYRAIGVKKLDIYKMFISESFAISTLASLPGVLFMSYCLHVLSDVDYIGRNYVMNIYIMILCIVIMYVFNIIVGLIPVFNTIRKSPARILSGKEVD